MNRTVTSLIFLIFSSFVQAQSADMERILNLPRIQISKIQPEKSESAIILPSDFSRDQVQKQVEKIDGVVEKVFYIYTGYAQSASFNQRLLDEKRIKKLAAIYPEVLSNRFVNWEMIEQTGCNSAEEGKKYFHGFVVQFREVPTAESREEELKRLESFFMNPEAGFIAPDTNPLENQFDNESTEKTKTEDEKAQFPGGNYALFQYFRDSLPGGGKMALNRDDLWAKFKVSIDSEGNVGAPQFQEDYPDYIEKDIERVFKNMPKWTPETKNQIPVASTIDLELRMSFSPIVRGMYNRDGKKPDFKEGEVEEFQSTLNRPSTEAEARISKTERSSIYKGMEKIATREKVAVVMDVTSSMSSHVAALSWWISNSKDSLNVVHYTFFNDGDNRPDNTKKIGKTGGIYHGERLFDYTAILMDAMRNGTGGDLEENDLEAVLEAQSKVSGADALLLIVDNFSDVRDLSLLDEVTRKVHVLVAGEVAAVRECYLDIAKRTGGDMIVNGKRIPLENMVAGMQISVAESTYIFDGNRFRIL